MTSQTMTSQEVFDTVVRHLGAQRAKSIKDDVCMYRAPDGKKCAVGAIIRDDEYLPSMEGNSVLAIELPARLLPHDRLLRALQHVHDIHYVKGWPSALRTAADVYGLNPEVIDEAFA